MGLVVFIVVAAVGYVALKGWRSLRLSREIEKHVINRFGEHCKKCDQDYYVCSICGCQFDEELDALRCRDWDLILRRNHKHTYLHDHEEDK